MSANEGTSNISLLCKLHGNPYFTIEWYKDENKIDERAYTISNTTVIEKYRTIMESILNISNIKRTDYGNYSCKAENKIGTKVDSTLLIVKCKYYHNILFQALCRKSYTRVNRKVFAIQNVQGADAV